MTWEILNRNFSDGEVKEMADKNKNRTEADVRRVKIFTTRVSYDMFCVYWRYLCCGINPKSVNRNEKPSC